MREIRDAKVRFLHQGIYGGVHWPAFRGDDEVRDLRVVRAARGSHREEKDKEDHGQLDRQIELRGRVLRREGGQAEGKGRPCLVEEIDIFPGRLLFGDLVCECPPSDARPFVWRVERLISSLRNDCALRDPGMTRRCLHKVLVCLHLDYQCNFVSLPFMN